jgi:hypothetical protein
MCLMNPNISHKPSKPHSHDAKLTVPLPMFPDLFLTDVPGCSMAFDEHGHRLLCEVGCSRWAFHPIHVPRTIHRDEQQ